MNVVSETVSDLQSNGQSIFNQIKSKLTLDNIIAYLLQGLTVAIAAYLIPNRRTTLHEVSILAIVSGLTFMLLDTFTVDIGKYARLGAGAGIGLSLSNLNAGQVTWLNGIV